MPLIRPEFQKLNGYRRPEGEGQGAAMVRLHLNEAGHGWPEAARAELLARLGRHAEALAQFQQAVQYHADYYEARFNLANSLAALNRLDEAMAELEKLLEQKPDWAPARKRLEQLQQRKPGEGP